MSKGSIPEATKFVFEMTPNPFKGDGQKVDARNQKDITKYILYQILSPSDTQEDSKFVFEKSSNPLRL